MLISRFMSKRYNWQMRILGVRVTIRPIWQIVLLYYQVFLL